MLFSGQKIKCKWGFFTAGVLKEHLFCTFIWRKLQFIRLGSKRIPVNHPDSTKQLRGVQSVKNLCQVNCSFSKHGSFQCSSMTQHGRLFWIKSDPYLLEGVVCRVPFRVPNPEYYRQTRADLKICMSAWNLLRRERKTREHSGFQSGVR